MTIAHFHPFVNPLFFRSEELGMKVSPAAMIIVGDDVLGVPLGGARLELSQTMPMYKDGRTFCPCIIPTFLKN